MNFSNEKNESLESLFEHHKKLHQARCLHKQEWKKIWALQNNLDLICENAQFKKPLPPLPKSPVPDLTPQVQYALNLVTKLLNTTFKDPIDPLKKDLFLVKHYHVFHLIQHLFTSNIDQWASFATEWVIQRYPEYQDQAQFHAFKAWMTPLEKSQDESTSIAQDVYKHLLAVLQLSISLSNVEKDLEWIEQFGSFTFIRLFFFDHLKKSPSNLQALFACLSRQRKYSIPINQAIPIWIQKFQSV